MKRLLLILSWALFWGGQATEAQAQEKKLGKPEVKSFEVVLKSYINAEGLTLKSKQKLDKLLKILPQFPEVQIFVEAHTSNYNLFTKEVEDKKQSQKRSEEIAKEVRDFLINEGVKGEIVAKGFGADKPYTIPGSKKGKKPVVLNPEQEYARWVNERIIVRLVPKFDDDTKNLQMELLKEDVEYAVNR